MNAESCHDGPVCESVMDHDWGTLRLLESGTDERRGRYHTFAKRCTKCGRRVTETRWVVPTVEALRKVEEPKDDVKQQADEEDE